MVRRALCALSESALAMGKLWWFVFWAYFLMFTCWLLAPLIIGFLIPPALAIITFVLARKLARQGKPAWLLILSSPLLILPAYNIANATTGYINGTAVVREWRMIGADPAASSPDDIDRNLRCRSAGAFGSIVPLNFFTGWPYNLTITALTHTFGVMRGAYRGPLPGMGTASLHLDRQGVAISQARFRSNKLRLDGRPVTITSRLAYALLDEPQPYNGLIGPRLYWLPPEGDLQLALFAPECLLVRAHSKDGPAYIAVVDLAHQRVIRRERDPLDDFRSTGLG